jgi:hypothetical protein
MAENNVLEIIRGLSQAASLAYDGLDSDGERIKAGLKREEGHLINDKRVIDGFGVKFHGNKLIVTYHGEVNMKEVHARGPKRFEEEMESMFGDITSFLKKEYKKATGKTCTLKSVGEADSILQRMSSIRNWVQSQKVYEIGGLGDAVVAVEPEDCCPAPSPSLDENIRNFLAQAKN